jgi:hypothetical protein
MAHKRNLFLRKYNSRTQTLKLAEYCPDLTLASSINVYCEQWISYMCSIKVELCQLQKPVSVTPCYLGPCTVYPALSVSMQEWFQKQLKVGEISQLRWTVDLCQFFPSGTANQVHGSTSTPHLALHVLRNRETILSDLIIQGKLYI